MPDAGAPAPEAASGKRTAIVIQWPSGPSGGYAVASGAAISFQGNVDGVPDKPPSDLVGPCMRRSDDPGPRRCGNAAVRHHREILYRHASSRQRDDTGQTTLRIS